MGQIKNKRRFPQITRRFRRCFYLRLSAFTPKILTVFFIALSLVGCGYTTGSLLPSHLKTVHVPPFKNKISYTTERTRNLYFPLIEVKAREAVVDRFLFDGNLKIADESVADLILKGELINYERIGLRFNDDDDREVEEYRIHVTMSLTMMDTRSGEILWEEPRFIGETTYFTTGPLAKAENVAVEEALVDLARRIVERTIEDW